MADSAVAVTAGSGTNIDTRTEGTNGNHRQVVVLGDPATNSGVAPVDATSGLSVTLTTAIPAGTAAIGKLAANSGVDIGDVDVTSVLPGSSATALGKAVDAAAGAADVGVALLAVRDDSLSTLTPADGDYTHLRVSSTGALHVTGSSGVTEFAEDSAHQSGDNGIMILGVRQSTQSDFGADGDYVPLSIDDDGAVRVKDVSLTAPGQGNAAASASVVEASDSVLVTSIKTDDAAFTAGTTTVRMAGFFADESSTDSVDEGDAGAARMTLDRKQIVTPQPHTAGGLSIFRSLDLDETEEAIKASAGQLYKLRIANFRTSSAVFVKLYDDTVANVSVGTTTPVDTICVPVATAASNPTIITEAFGGMGMTFANAITIAATTALADNDTGAPGANEVVVTGLYK